MAVENLLGSLVMTNLDASIQTLVDVGLNGGRVRAALDTVEVSAAASVASTYRMHRLPSNARIMPGSKVMFDDLASSGSPLIDIGVQSITGKSDITADPDALNDGIDVAGAAGEAALVKDIANWGLPLWDYVNGVTADPGVLLDIYISITDAATNTGGTITSLVIYTVD